MADEDLRELERAAASGDPQARVQLLLERMRAGRMTQERLKVAAHCGDRAAREVLGDDAPPPDESEPLSPLYGWFQGLIVGGEEALLRAYVASTRRSMFWWDVRKTMGAMPKDVQEEYLALREKEPDRGHSKDLDAIYARLRNPEDHPLRRSMRLAERAVLSFPDQAARDAFWEQQQLPYREVMYPHSDREAPMDDPEELDKSTVRAAQTVSFALKFRHEFGVPKEPEDIPPPDPEYMRRDAPGRHEIRRVITAELLPWGAGDGDPLREAAPEWLLAGGNPPPWSPAAPPATES